MIISTISNGYSIWIMTTFSDDPKCELLENIFEYPPSKEAKELHGYMLSKGRICESVLGINFYEINLDEDDKAVLLLISLLGGLKDNMNKDLVNTLWRIR